MPLSEHSSLLVSAAKLLAEYGISFLSLCFIHTYRWQMKDIPVVNHGRHTILRLDLIFNTWAQGGLTCGAIDEPRKSSKAIDERVIINFCNKNVVIARFCDKNGFFYPIYIYMCIYFYVCILCFIYFSVLLIAFLLYRKLFCSIDSFSVLSIDFLFYR